MVRFGFDNTPKYLRVELENRDRVPEINEMFIARLLDKVYLIGRIESLESIFIEDKEHYFAIVKTTTLIMSNISYNPGMIPMIPL